MAARLIVLCGTSFSGKSTVARELARRLPAQVVSMDEINDRRGLWGGAGIPLEEWSRTFQQAQTEALELLSSGTPVIVDDTSSPRFLRDAWRELAAGVGAEFILVYVETDETTVRARRDQNRITHSRRDVTDTVLNHHLSTFEPPAADEGALSVEQIRAIGR
ncbi:hypothetical protein GCM10009630_16770 [Kribbella jejuensis]|uniref:Putative kinase n=1 Tax=Kribbella jejuensis TaxID=236068 RepID=A0A542EB83_9ACTN|nr:ATP-binding protein [Kribbella jejuensis]TQJ12607.1 putative kinase [Kribbella jejuensis]